MRVISGVGVTVGEGGEGGVSVPEVAVVVGVSLGSTMIVSMGVGVTVGVIASVGVFTCVATTVGTTVTTGVSVAVALGTKTFSKRSLWLFRGWRSCVWLTDALTSTDWAKSDARARTMTTTRLASGSLEISPGSQITVRFSWLQWPWLGSIPKITLPAGNTVVMIGLSAGLGPPFETNSV